MTTTEAVVQKAGEDDQRKGAVAFIISKPIDLAQLGLELQEKLELDTEPGLSASGPLKTASKKNPVTVWIYLEEVNLTTLRAVVKAHDVKASPWDLIMGKAQEGEDYTPEEIQVILRNLVLGS